jgi:hypothetical protein
MPTRITAANIAPGAITADRLAEGAGGGPRITNVQVTDDTYTVIDDTAVSLSGGYVKITGTGFQTGCVAIVGTTTATATAFVSSNFINVQVPALSAGTYIVYVVNPDGGVAIRVNGLTYSATPTWITGSSLPEQAVNSLISIQLSANSDSTVAYSVASGSTLPPGVTLSSSGLLSGTVTGINDDTVYSFTVEAIDTENQESPRSFSITITVREPYFNLTRLLLNGDSVNAAQNNTFLDSSSNNFTVTRSGNTTQGSLSPFSYNGWSNFFNEGRITYTASGVFPEPLSGWNTSTGIGTIEAWVYPTAIDSTGNAGHTMSTIVSVGDTYFAFGLRSDNKLRLYWWTGSQNTIDSTGTIPGLNQWIHVAITRNNSNIEFFINGVSAGTSSAYTGVSAWNTGSNGQVLQIGQNNGSSVTADFYGYISNLRFSNNVRTVTVPTADYTSDANTLMLTCMRNNFVDTGPSAYDLSPAGSTPPSVVPFSPFPPIQAYSPVVNGGSGYFDGTDDFLSIASNSAFDFPGDFTIEFFIQIPNITNTVYQRILSRGAFQTGASDWLIVCRPSERAIFFQYGNPNVTFGILNILWANTWHHVAMVRQGTTFKAYIDGTERYSNTLSVNFTNTRELRVGTNFNGGEFFQGNLSNIRVVKGTAVYTSNFTPPTAPVTAINNTSLLLNFTNAAIIDSTSRNNVETLGNVQISTSIKKYGTGSLVFDGNGDWLYLPPSTELGFGSGNWTVEAWVYSANYNLYQTLFTNRYNGEGVGLYVGSEAAGGKLVIANNTTVIGNGGTLSNNVWTHVAFVREGSSIKGYLNGSLVVTASDSRTYSQITSVTIGGNNNNTQNFIGYIDDLRITKGLARYTSNFTPPTSAHRLS